MHDYLKDKSTTAPVATDPSASPKPFAADVALHTNPLATGKACVVNCAGVIISDIHIV